MSNDAANNPIIQEAKPKLKWWQRVGEMVQKASEKVVDTFVPTKAKRFFNKLFGFKQEDADMKNHGDFGKFSDKLQQNNQEAHTETAKVTAPQKQTAPATVIQTPAPTNPQTTLETEKEAAAKKAANEAVKASAQEKAAVTEAAKASAATVKSSENAKTKETAQQGTIWKKGTIKRSEEKQTAPEGAGTTDNEGTIKLSPKTKKRPSVTSKTFTPPTADEMEKFAHNENSPARSHSASTSSLHRAAAKEVTRSKSTQVLD